MSDAQAPYYFANSAQASVEEAGGATDIEEIDEIEVANVPPTIITRVSGKGIPPRQITFTAATPSVQGNDATSKAPGPTTKEVLLGPDVSTEDPVARTNSKTRRKPPGPNKVVPTPASPPSVPHPSGSRAYAKMTDLDAVYQAILCIEDNSDNDDLLDLADL